MSTARVLIRQGGRTYRLAKLEARPDGSLIILFDRDPSAVRESQTFNFAEERRFVADPRQYSADKRAHAKFTCHTTGQINYYSRGELRRIAYVEPLYELTRPFSIGFLSPPRVSRLDSFQPTQHRHDVHGVIEMPDQFDGRLSFSIALEPNPPRELESLNVTVNYELYSVRLTLGPTPMPIPENLADHFVSGLWAVDAIGERIVDVPTAELKYLERIHNRRGPKVFREENGAYTIFSSVPMRVPPRMTVKFTREDLSFEQINSETNPPIHKVKFWICDKGGRNKTEDLRAHIDSIELDAELGIK